MALVVVLVADRVAFHGSAGVPQRGRNVVAARLRIGGRLLGAFLGLKVRVVRRVVSADLGLDLVGHLFHLVAETHENSFVIRRSGQCALLKHRNTVVSRWRSQTPPDQFGHGLPPPNGPQPEKSWTPNTFSFAIR